MKIYLSDSAIALPFCLITLENTNILGHLVRFLQMSYFPAQLKASSLIGLVTFITFCSTFLSGPDSMDSYIHSRNALDATKRFHISQDGTVLPIALAANYVILTGSHSKGVYSGMITGVAFLLLGAQIRGLLTR